MAREITDDNGITWSCIQASLGSGTIRRRRMPLASVDPTGCGSCALRAVAPHQFGLRREAGIPDGDLLQAIQKQLGANPPDRKEAR
jgi:hypothetical protein